MQTTSRYASRTSASLGEDYSFIALRFGTCMPNTIMEDCAQIVAETATEHFKQSFTRKASTVILGLLLAHQRSGDHC
ncbi:hypothetical protein [Prevotella bivia]|uniref:hypothetical protein n=1 Tax=Prevotella bivia TaxID=28125 RepID=UPI002ABB03A0|nr:hypothetical protein [Prevotella bivia]MDZ3818588.1 hypothetical protein [Prevotella bivia]